MIRDVFLLCATALLLAGGQLLWKISASKAMAAEGWTAIVEKLVCDLHFVAGCALYLLATGLWIYLLGKFEYSKIYPVFVGLCVLLSLLIGQLFLQESGNFMQKIAGSLLITAGIVLVVKS